ncbi:MAG: hypothetical protein U5N26_04730 [Candidatus Marinimicrobia bacterium]|nr:hypothetical protein [Candidatus Neomarinimicrobiota bacterium]
MNQIRESATALMQCGKQNNISIILIGHITKSGMIAGPKLLEHIVDTVLYLEGDRQHYFRVLRSVKNRFGSTQEIGIFEMKEDGLKALRIPGRYSLESARKAQAAPWSPVAWREAVPFWWRSRPWRPVPRTVPPSATPAGSMQSGFSCCWP